MEAQVDRLVQKLQWRIENSPAHQRILVAISGVPGSGKTTLAEVVTARLNVQNVPHPKNATVAPVAAYIPMDGYHYSRAQLSAMPDPENAHARRGAEFTFDGPSFFELVKAARAQTLESPILHAPSFDHALKDPKADDIAILPSVQVLVFEGNYLTLDKSPWKEAAELMDELWFVEVDFKTARTRLVERHVRTGVAATVDEADRRVTENDLVNGEEIVRCKVGSVDEVIFSREDDTWKSKVLKQLK